MTSPTSPGARSVTGEGPPPPVPVGVEQPSDRRAPTELIAELIAERRAIRKRMGTGTGMSDADDHRIRAIDAAVDRLWADLRRQRLPMPQFPVRRPAKR